MKTRPIRWLLAVVLLVSSGAPALAQQDNRLLLELLNRIELLEQELRQLRGDMEVYRYRQEQESADAQALRQRLLGLEAQLASGGPAPAVPASQSPGLSDSGVDPVVGGTPPVPRQPPGRLPESPPGDFSTPPQTATAPPVQETPVAPPVVQSTSPPTESEQAAYDAAFGRLREGQYNQAVEAFQGFLQQYPNSSLSPNAQYWLGEVYYVMREFDAARETFIQLGSRYPDSNRLPDTLLKLGYIYEEQGDAARAREVYSKLMELYPGSRPAGLAEQRLAVLP